MLWSVLRLIFKTSSVTPDFFYVFNLILSFLPAVKVLKEPVRGKFLGANVLKENAVIAAFIARLTTIKYLLM